MEKESIWHNAAKHLSNFFISLDELLNSTDEPLTFDDYLENVSKFTDKKILAQEKKEKLKYVGGKCNISYDSKSKSILSKVELYYKNSSDAWVKSSFDGKTSIERFMDKSKNEEIARIIKGDIISIPIDYPDKQSEVE